MLFFFFQAEDGIRDIGVTGVQTCALPIWIFLAGRSQLAVDDLAAVTSAWQAAAGPTGLWVAVDQEGGNVQTLSGPGFGELRSEERRVGKECRSRWSPYH